MVVARRDVGDQRPEGVERGFLAVFELLVHVFLDFVHGYMAGAFDEHLHIVFPGPFRRSPNWALSLASWMLPGRIPSPNESPVSYLATISQISSKCV